MDKLYLFMCCDVSGSMKEPYNRNYNINQNSPKSESLFEILERSIKIISKKQKSVSISSFLFGCQKSPITDFLSLIDFIIDNKSFIKQTFEKNLQDKDINYRDKLIDLLQRQGAKNIAKYMERPESPSYEECKLFYKILKDRYSLTRKIVEELPSAAKSDISSGMVTFGAYLPIFGEMVKNNESESIREETLRIKKKLSGLIENDKELNKLNNYKWEVNIPSEKPPKDVLNKLKILYNEFPKINGSNNIFQMFEEYIYGETPLCNCLEKSLNFLSNKESNSKKVLIIISDGQSTDGDPMNIFNNYKINNLFIVGGFISSTHIQNEKTLYHNLNSSDSGARQLFDLSSEVDTDNIAFDYLRDKGWNIPLTGKCKVFIQMNNVDNINDFLEFINKFIDGTEDVLGDILGKIELKELTGKNISDFEITNQEIGNCYLHATRNIIRMARARIYPPNIPLPNVLEEEIVKEFPYQKDINGKIKGRNTFEVLQKMVPKYRLQVKQIFGDNINELEKNVKKILIRRRPVVLAFRLTKKQWHNFCEFFRKDSINKRNIITYDIINKNVPNDDEDGGGHATVITKYDKECITVLNSWGDEWGDGGFFKIKNFSVFKKLRCFDVFFTLKDLTQYEIDEYNKFVEKKKKEFLEDY